MPSLFKLELVDITIMSYIWTYAQTTKPNMVLICSIWTKCFAEEVLYTEYVQ